MTYTYICTFMSTRVRRRLDGRWRVSAMSPFIETASVVHCSVHTLSPVRHFDTDTDVTRI